MKKIIGTFLAFFIITVCYCNIAKIELCYEERNIINDSIYFSFNSNCNIILKIIDKKNAILNINGKLTNGQILKNRSNKDFYDFKVNNRSLITFSYEDSSIIVENQKYQFNCEGAKFIELNRTLSDEDAYIKIKKYLEDNSSAFDNLDLINDKAFYLEQMNFNKASAFILDKIIAKNPDRVVAWLNLADVYWKLNKKSESKKKYLKYSELMKSQGKDLKKIPERVYDRIK